MPTASQSTARLLDSAANAVMGLSLEDIGEDGHAIANKLWRIATHLRNRSRMNVSPDVIRTWARLQGYRVRDTGRVPAVFVEEYYDEVLSSAGDI